MEVSESSSETETGYLRWWQAEALAVDEPSLEGSLLVSIVHENQSGSKLWLVDDDAIVPIDDEEGEFEVTDYVEVLAQILMNLEQQFEERQSYSGVYQFMQFDGETHFYGTLRVTELTVTVDYRDEEGTEYEYEVEY